MLHHSFKNKVFSLIEKVHIVETCAFSFFYYFSQTYEMLIMFYILTFYKNNKLMIKMAYGPITCGVRDRVLSIRVQSLGRESY